MGPYLFDIPGQEKADDVADKAGLTIPNTASRGQEIIREEVHNLKDQFDVCFATCADSQTLLGRYSNHVRILNFMSNPNLLHVTKLYLLLF